MIEEVFKKLSWLGHDSIRFQDKKTVYFDPFQIAAGPPADLILISHDHFDHCSPEDVAKIQTKDTFILTEPESAKKLTGRVETMRPGDVRQWEGFTIEAVPSYNTDKDFHPKKNNWLGFVLTVEGVRIYHPGDADFIPEMKSLKADIAFLPVSGTYVMTARQAAEAARAIKPQIAVPMHYGAIVGSEQDAAEFKKLLQGEVDVRILKKI
jgi:L-ascorbate metabolism protein UlaG (beta-lactamase superfamily)